MLGLIQIMNYMLVRLEYTAAEVEPIFASIEAGHSSVEDLTNELEIDISPTLLRTVAEKIGMWPSALRFTLMRLEPSLEVESDT